MDWTSDYWKDYAELIKYRRSYIDYIEEKYVSDEPDDIICISSLKVVISAGKSGKYVPNFGGLSEKYNSKPAEYLITKEMESRNLINEETPKCSKKKLTQRKRFPIYNKCTKKIKKICIAGRTKRDSCNLTKSDKETTLKNSPKAIPESSSAKKIKKICNAAGRTKRDSCNLTKSSKGTKLKNSPKDIPKSSSAKKIKKICNAGHTKRVNCNLTESNKETKLKNSPKDIPESSSECPTPPGLKSCCVKLLDCIPKDNSLKRLNYTSNSRTHQETSVGGKDGEIKLIEVDDQPIGYDKDDLKRKESSEWPTPPGLKSCSVKLFDCMPKDNYSKRLNYTSNSRTHQETSVGRKDGEIKLIDVDDQPIGYDKDDEIGKESSENEDSVVSSPSVSKLTDAVGNLLLASPSPLALKVKLLPSTQQTNIHGLTDEKNTTIISSVNSTEIGRRLRKRRNDQIVLTKDPPSLKKDFVGTPLKKKKILNNNHCHKNAFNIEAAIELDYKFLTISERYKNDIFADNSKTNAPYAKLHLKRMNILRKQSSEIVDIKNKSMYDVSIGENSSLLDTSARPDELLNNPRTIPKRFIKRLFNKEIILSGELMSNSETLPKKFIISNKDASVFPDKLMYNSETLPKKFITISNKDVSVLPDKLMNNSETLPKKFIISNKDASVLPDKLLNNSETLPKRFIKRLFNVD